MEGAKSTCSRCGVSILDSTKDKTGGYCVPCKRLLDLESDIRKKREITNARQELTRRKYGKHVGFAIRLIALAFMVFGSTLQLYDQYPRIQGLERTSFISLLIVIVSGVAIVFFTALFSFHVWDYVKYLKSVRKNSK
jgi:hypothetical protein